MDDHPGYMDCAERAAAEICRAETRAVTGRSDKKQHELCTEHVASHVSLPSRSFLSHIHSINDADAGMRAIGLQTHTHVGRFVTVMPFDEALPEGPFLPRFLVAMYLDAMP